MYCSKHLVETELHHLTKRSATIFTLEGKIGSFFYSSEAHSHRTRKRDVAHFARQDSAARQFAKNKTAFSFLHHRLIAFNLLMKRR